MSKYIIIIGIILLLASCEKDTAPSNPCDTQRATSAAFTIKEARYVDIIEPELTDFLLDTDICYMRSVFFEAAQQEADSFIWQVGSEIEPRYGKRINVIFPDNLRGTNFNVRLIVKRNKPNIRCFPNDNGIDTVTRTFYFVRYNEPLSWEGTYYGSDADKPDSMYTIVLGHSYDDNKEEDILKVFGVPRGCADTINEWISANLITYKNIGFRRGGIDCSGKVIKGIYKRDSKYIINQEHLSFLNGFFVVKTRVFTGVKIN